MILNLIVASLVVCYLLVPMNRVARYAFAMLIVSAFHIVAWPSNRESYLLEKHGTHTVGVVTAKDCAVTAAQWISYKFQAGGKEYEGRRGVGGGRAGCEGVVIGSQTFVTYLDKNPSISRPVGAVDSIWFIGLLLTAGAFAALIWMNAEQTRYRERRPQLKEGNA